MKKPNEESREIGLDKQMQADNLAAFIPRPRTGPARHQPPLEPDKANVAGAESHDDDPGPSAA